MNLGAPNFLANTKKVFKVNKDKSYLERKTSGPGVKRSGVAPHWLGLIVKFFLLNFLIEIYVHNSIETLHSYREVLQCC